MIPDLRRKLISIWGGDETCTDAQLLEFHRAKRKAHDFYRDAYESRPAYDTTWEHVELGQMVVTRHGPDAGVAAWMIAGRQSSGEDTVKLLFVRLIEPTEMPEIMWLDKHLHDPVTVLNMGTVGHGTAALEGLRR